MLGVRCGRWLAVAVIVALGLLQACGGGGGGKATVDDRPMLEKLGVPTNLPPRTDAQTLQPLEQRNFVYQKRSELYLSGVYTTDAAQFAAPYYHKRQVLLDDATSGAGGGLAYAPLFTDTAYEGWTVHDAASTAADLDGDGRQEVVVLYRNQTVTPAQAFLRVIRKGAAGYQQTDAYPLAGDFTFSYFHWTFDHLQIAAGDLDGDGADELVVAAGARLIVLKWSPDAFRVVDERRYRTGETLAQITTVAVGNVDDDPTPEVVVANGVYSATIPGKYYVYKLVSGALVEVAGGAESTFTEADDAEGGARNIGYARVAIGDLDGDNLGEIVFAGDVFDNLLSVTVMGYDPATRTFKRVTTSRFARNWAEQWLPVAAVLDAEGLEGGRQKDLLVYPHILHLDAKGKLADRWASLVLPSPYADKVTVGDFTGDGRDDVAFISADQWLLIYGLADGQFKEVRRIDLDADGQHSTLCAVNVDGDSTVLQYTGEYELLYSDPQILAVLASPPYYAGQDASNASTTFEWEAGSEDQGGHTLGFYVGLSLGYSAETPFWGSAGSSKLAFTVDSSMDWNFTSGSEQSSSHTFSCPAGENQVIFASTPIDVYYYLVVASPDATQLGSRIAVQIPRTPRVKPMNVDLYNAAVTESYRVPAGLLEHTMGDPWSYASRADMLALFTDGTTILNDATKGPYHEVIPVSETQGGFRTPDPFRVSTGRAGGTQGITLSKGASKGFGTEFNLQVGVELENVAGGVLVGGKAGFHYGYSHSYTTTEKTSISGTIPNVPMADKRLYTAGLFAYPYPSSGQARFVVVSYWVEE